MARIAAIERNTKETKIKVTLDLDGTGKSELNTKIGFFDHMLDGFARHGLFDLNVLCDGDTEVDCHHSIEDTGIVLGTAIREALGDKKGIRRYGSCILPMDEACVMCAVDLSGRPYLVYDLVPPVEKVGTLDTALFHEFFQAFCVKGGINLHVKLMAGGEIHHIFEAVFKGLARALEQAVSHDPKEKGIPSTKGIL